MSKVFYATKIIITLITSVLIMGFFVVFIFTPNEQSKSIKVAQEVGGYIEVIGIEIDHYEYCEYSVNLSYSPADTSASSSIGKVSGVIRNIKTCDRMITEPKSSIYSGLNIIGSPGSYSLEFSDGENPVSIFISSNLTSWQVKQ